VKMLKDAGASEVHVRISSPPFKYPCYFGTDVPSSDQLPAFSHTVEQIAEMIGAENRANLSGDSFAILFGEISPKIRTSTVVTIVETLAPFASPSIFTNKIVASEDIRGDYDK
jgi:glutamine phosphoribosylpyrophosphate amidotransferase